MLYSSSRTHYYWQFSPPLFLSISLPAAIQFYFVPTSYSTSDLESETDIWKLRSKSIAVVHHGCVSLSVCIAISHQVNVDHNNKKIKETNNLN